MGPEMISSEVDRSHDVNPMSPPKFLTGVTSKVVYRDTLRRWIRMINGCAEVDTKHKAILRSAGHLVYMACDGLSKELLKQKENSGKLNMDGETEDKNRSKLMESIIETIAKDTPNEAVMREVELLSNIQLCQRNNTETVPEFVGRYKGAVARYVNQTAELTEFANRQFAIIMLRNAKLASNTMNTVTFQITTKASSVENTHKEIEISLSEEEADYIKKVLSDEEHPANDHKKEIMKKMTKAAKRVSERTGCVFNMEEAAQSLSQVKSEDISEVVIPQTRTMLGKRTNQFTQKDRGDRIQRMKAESKCRGCGEYGHWFRDRTECAKKVQDKDGNKKMEWTRDESKNHKQDETMEKEKVNTFFRPGGK